MENVQLTETPAGVIATKPSERLATDQIGADILKALGLEDQRVHSLSIHFDAQELVLLKITTYLEEPHGEELLNEFAKIAKTYHLVEVVEAEKDDEAEIPEGDSKAAMQGLIRHTIEG